ncbi:unnamed protein product [[Actinomadura] parvosata subsp. kistnae]|nr:unnamed protein product [Actinomadura parvosata subsp. kistnae]
MVRQEAEPPQFAVGSFEPSRQIGDLVAELLVVIQRALE